MTEALRDQDQLLPVDSRVEIRDRFDQRWSPGFTVVAASPDGYRICRSSDHTVLPALFARTDVRRERKRSLWWV